MRVEARHPAGLRPPDHSLESFAMEQLRIGFLVLAGGRVEIDPSLYRVIGYPVDSAGKDALAFLRSLPHPEDRARFAEELERATQGSFRRSVHELRIRRGAGEYAWVRQTLAREGERVVGTFQDISDFRVAAERAGESSRVERSLDRRDCAWAGPCGPCRRAR